MNLGEIFTTVSLMTLRSSGRPSAEAGGRHYHHPLNAASEIPWRMPLGGPLLGALNMPWMSHHPSLNAHDQSIRFPSSSRIPWGHSPGPTKPGRWVPVKACVSPRTLCTVYTVGGEQKQVGDCEYQISSCWHDGFRWVEEEDTFVHEEEEKDDTHGKEEGGSGWEDQIYDEPQPSGSGDDSYNMETEGSAEREIMESIQLVSKVEQKDDRNGKEQVGESNEHEDTKENSVEDKMKDSIDPNSVQFSDEVLQSIIDDNLANIQDHLEQTHMVSTMEINNDEKEKGENKINGEEDKMDKNLIGVQFPDEAIQTLSFADLPGFNDNFDTVVSPLPMDAFNETKHKKVKIDILADIEALGLQNRDKTYDKANQKEKQLNKSSHENNKKDSKIKISLLNICNDTVEESLTIDKSEPLGFSVLSKETDVKGLTDDWLIDDNLEPTVGDTKMDEVENDGMDDSVNNEEKPSIIQNVGTEERRTGQPPNQLQTTSQIAHYMSLGDNVQEELLHQHNTVNIDTAAFDSLPSIDPTLDVAALLGLGSKTQKNSPGNGQSVKNASKQNNESVGKVSEGSNQIEMGKNKKRKNNNKTNSRKQLKKSRRKVQSRKQPRYFNLEDPLSEAVFSDEPEVLSVLSYLVSVK